MRKHTAKQISKNNAQRTQSNRKIITLSAYSIWEQEGRPDGKQEVHWLQAESQLRKQEPAIVYIADMFINPRGLLKCWTHKCPDKQCGVEFQLFTALLRFRSGWFANHALLPTPGGVGSSVSRFTSTDPAWLSLGRWTGACDSRLGALKLQLSPQTAV